MISIGGGKGGVGKSLVATNLAVAIAQTGREVVLCDLDLGAANLHLMLGAAHAKAGISALLSPDATLDDALTDTRVPRLRLLAGAGGTVAAANITHSQKLRIIRKLRSLRADFVVIDVGAGVSYNALDFFELGQQRIIVATPQVTSMHDAYAFLKGAVLRTLRHHAGRSNEAWMLDPAMASKEGEKVKDLLLRIREQDAAFGQRIERILKHFGAFLVGNQVDNPGQVGVFQAVSRMVEDFLGISLPILGWIPAQPRLGASINERLPFMAQPERADSREARAFRAVVEALLVGDLAPEEELLVELVEDDLRTAAPLPQLDPAAPDVAPILSQHAAAHPAPPPPVPVAPAVAAPVAPPSAPPPHLSALPPAALAPQPPAAPALPPPLAPVPPPLPPPAAAPPVAAASPIPPPPAPRAAAAPPPPPASSPPVARAHQADPDAPEPISDEFDDQDLREGAEGPIAPRIYVRPSRKRKVDSEEKKRRRAQEQEGRRRRLTLPGMTPRHKGH